MRVVHQRAARPRSPPPASPARLCPAPPRSTKAGMTQIFGSDGNAYPATVIALESGNIVTAVRTMEKDGYVAVQVGPGSLFVHLFCRVRR